LDLCQGTSVWSAPLFGFAHSSGATHAAEAAPQPDRTRARFSAAALPDQAMRLFDVIETLARKITVRWRQAASAPIGKSI